MAALSRRPVPPWVRRWIPSVARAGFAARGALYLVVGYRAARSGFGWGGRPTDHEGALRAVSRVDHGEMLLAALGLGLSAYAVWRFAQAAWDLDGKGGRLTGLAVRASYVVSGALHAVLALTAAGMLLGLPAGRSRSVREWVARALSEPLGEWVVGLAGVATLGAAAWQLFKGWSGKDSEKLDLSRARAGTALWVPRLERFGVAARAATFGIIGWFLLMSAWSRSAREAKGLADALRTLRAQPPGPWLLGAVGLGLAAYGVLSLVSARYRRVAG